jgi:hypothetical protein
MINLEIFVNEKLKVSKNSESYRIKTTLRKFLAWFTGKDEYHINRYDLEERNFISSNKSMSFGDKTDFLYKHINDTIYMSEEEKLTHTETGLSGMAKSKLYDYSFEIEGITFNIDARIYGDDELLSNNRQYIITEKLKVSANTDYGLKEFDFDGFRNKLDKTHPISVSPFLDDDEEIVKVVHLHKGRAWFSTIASLILFSLALVPLGVLMIIYHEPTMLDEEDMLEPGIITLCFC